MPDHFADLNIAIPHLSSSDNKKSKLFVIPGIMVSVLTRSYLVLRTENPCVNISVYFPVCTSPEYSA